MKLLAIKVTILRKLCNHRKDFMCLDQYFTMKEVQALLKVSKRTVQRMMDEGQIEATELPVGRYGRPEVRFTADTINNALSTRKPKKANNDRN